MKRTTSYMASNELEIYQAVVEALPLSMFLMDKDKKIIGIFNAAPEVLAGLSVEQIIGKSILTYADDSESPFHEACSMLNSTFDSVFETGIPLKFEYKIMDSHLEATISKISNDRILSQVRDISDIVSRQRDVEYKKHNELSMALMAGGLTSWSYDVEGKMLSSKLQNNVIGDLMSFSELLSAIVPEHRQVTIDMFDDIILRGHKESHITIQVLNREGKIQWSDVYAIPHEYDHNGKVTHIVGSQKDRTSEHEYQEQLKQINRQNELILNNSTSGFAFLTPNMKVEWENISKVFANQQIAINLSSGTLTSSRDLCCGRNTVEQALESKSLTINKCVGSNDRILEFIAQPIFGEHKEVEGIVLRIDDITEKEGMLVELAQAKEHAEQSDKLKSAFLANMSHEIRTPLNSIVGFAHLISEAESQEEQHNYINIVESNSDILLSLINDILDLSKIEAGYFTCNDTEFNLSALFTELEFVFKHKIQSHINLICSIPCDEYIVKLDRTRIAQVVTNFMTNATKFTKQGYIKMGFEIVPEGVKLFVEDTGCGMSEEQVAHVFDRFEKFNTFEQGTGLGTAIAKAIVSAYNGKIGAFSELGKGSTFWAVLPTNVTDAAPTAPQSEALQTAVNKGISEIRILVAEDNDSNYMLIKALLKGLNITRAINGQEAVDAISNELFDLILMDIQMPVMDGVEATRQIRKFNPTIPIIAVTANAFEEDKQRALAAGMNEFITKPINKMLLQETLEKIRQ